METANLCQCNQCNGIFIDSNPQAGAKEYPDYGYPELTWVYEETAKPETAYYACPVCLTDAYLQDEITWPDWIVTDPDCNQMYREILPDRVYEFKEDRITNPETGEIAVFTAVIDLDEIMREDPLCTSIVEACQPFGYTPEQVHKWIDTGDEWPLIAECIFELSN